ncbi:helix-turn-helix domain-containing protein [filamentous cyanobacterium LEGE 11480]|uniref:Helix-turn-helix domain-containing protein n=1 Tax=Romeriopsis navalis LEGE 11480 TaxID=2777977 RepID=A0A928VT14_9CYAN|nr:helix-turn-helix domain-containing protein [Romeriopsis navalis]MBE9032486.1 helix-turn-helix domain-containing protein [Romeriopsis navalis LEGE 11480]
MESRLAEQLTRISEQLKSTREQAGIELEQVASQTFIPLRLLKAMDEGKFERLPEPVFVQGFIRRYGDVVGLDGKNLAQEFTVQPPTLKKPAEEFLSYHPDDEPAAAPRNNRSTSKLKVPEPLPPEPAAPEAPAPSPVEAVAPPATTPIPDPATTPIPDPPVAEPPAAITPPAVAETASTPSPTTEVVAPETPTVKAEPPSIPTAEPAVAATAVPEAPAPAVSEPPSLETASTANLTPPPVVASETPAETAPEPPTPRTTVAQATEDYWSPSPMGNNPPSGNEGNNKLVYWIAGLAALALLALGAILISQPKSGNDNRGQSSESSSRQSDTAQEAKQPPPASPAPSPQSDAPITLSIKVTDDSWVEVITDGKVVISEILPQGTTQTWTAKDRLSITSGNAQGVTFSYNQAAEKPMGPTANPLTLVFPPKP